MALLEFKISIEGNGLCTSVYYKSTDSQSYLLYSSSHPSQVKNSILFHNFSDFVVYVVTTLIFPKNQRQCARFSINVAILFLSFKRATTVPNKSIDSQHYKRLRRKTLTAFHSLSHFTLTTTRLNLLLLKTLNYSKTIQRLALSFRNPPLVSFKRDKNVGNFLVRSSFQTNDQSGTFKCARSRCKTCPFIHNAEKISGPKGPIKITDHFTCTSANVIYCITCTYCNKLYISETGRRLGDQFREHLRDVGRDDKDASKPVARLSLIILINKWQFAAFPYI